ncbi:MAG: DUF423 domain-containing protein [Gammaproteobacteria bacterium]|nr:DUF423 domain-containing protein [Gammaproteobacteria bacterium]
MNAKFFLLAGAVFNLLAVVLGAFGAHALKNKLSADLLRVYHTAVEYQFYHALALLAIGILMLQWPHNTVLKSSGLSFFVGVLIFSGSLYALALSSVRWLGAITPLGGVAFIIGWILLSLAIWRQAI